MLDSTGNGDVRASVGSGCADRTNQAWNTSVPAATIAPNAARPEPPATARVADQRWRGRMGTASTNGRTAGAVSGIEPRALDAIEFRPQGRRVLVVATGRFGLRKECTGPFGLSLRQQLARRRQHLLGAPLALGERRTRPIDVGARAGVGAVQKQDSRPDMNGVFVLAGEVPIESFDEQAPQRGCRGRRPRKPAWTRDASFQASLKSCGLYRSNSCEYKSNDLCRYDRGDGTTVPERLTLAIFFLFSN